MDKRSWPWKKKSSDKAGTEKTVATSDSPAATTEDDQDNYQKPKYVQISAETYSHLNGLEDQVKTYEDHVKTLENEVEELNEKLAAAHTELTNQEGIVKQHAKVAEEAVSGWEKAEAEALALKNHLESVTLLKLTAEDRASHLDGALKECMRQIRNLKEEHEQRLHDVVLTKTKQWDKIKQEFEAKLSSMDQQLHRSAAENSALSRSLQERSNMVIKISEEKSQAEAEIEMLKSTIESCERETNSLKYELRIVAKELDIRNEEKNMSVRAAEVANKQQLEGVKKIAKLEAECQRLRGLVRKKLPSPAALAQMKLEVDSLGRDYGETRTRRSPPVKPPSPHSSHMSEFSLDIVQKFQKENDFLAERLLAMEEETNTLKEALAKRNSELQVSRNVCAKTVSKLQSLESQLQVNNQLRVPTISNDQTTPDGLFTHSASSPPSFTSVSEDGNDDQGSYAGSWATAMISELSHSKKENSVGRPSRAESANQLELMDDFLEMEKLANGSSGVVSGSDVSVINNRAEVAEQSKAVTTDLGSSPDIVSRKQELSDPNPHYDVESVAKKKLQSVVALVESMSKDYEVKKILDDIRLIVQETNENLQPHGLEGNICSDASSDKHEATPEKDGSMSKDSELSHTISEESIASISQIHDFVLILEKEAMSVKSSSPGGDGLSKTIQEFSDTFEKVIQNQKHLNDFVFDLSNVLNKASELQFSVLGYKNSEALTSSSDCIDKVALPENKLVQDTMGETYENGCSHFSDSISDPDIPNEGIPTSDSNVKSWKCSQEEFEQLKVEKENTVLELAKCADDLVSTRTQLRETEQLLSEIKSQLASAQNLNSLAETQLKCMAESYKSLEKKADELQNEVNLLRSRTESLDTELKEEKRNHEDALAKCKDLQEQMQRNERCAVADVHVKTDQEKEVAAAAEKLAECQETIFLLGKQLNAMRPQTDFMVSPYNDRSRKDENGHLQEPSTSGMNLQDFDQTETDHDYSTNLRRTGAESPMDFYNSPFTSSDTEANNPLKSPINSKHPKHRSTKSGSSTSLSPSAPTPVNVEKHSRGFSRFFSSKAKSSY